jgi:hypothetical protein
MVDNVGTMSTNHLSNPGSRWNCVATVCAVVDGLGHGQAVASAAKIAITTLAASAHEDIVSLVHRCHAALQGTRGVVLR